MGCSDIAFIGHDLSWGNIDKGYADGINSEKAAYQRDNKIFNNPVFWFYDLNGKPVTADLSFITFLHWINIFLKEFEKHNLKESVALVWEQWAWETLL
jgi:hypothetical protein